MSKQQLFCFTYAGGNATFFDSIEKYLTECELVKLEYSGHGTRHKEPFYQNFDALADDMFRLLKENYREGGYALFGYSMGTITLAEVLKRIIAEPNMSDPSYVFLAAHEPHSKAELKDFSSNECDEWVKDRTIRFGAVPDKLLDNKSFWRMYLPIYRADYSLIGRYSFEDLSLQTTIPTTIFYSELDTPRADMELWRRYFVGDCEFFQYDGSHFFIQKHYKEMAEVIRARIQGRAYK